MRRQSRTAYDTSTREYDTLISPDQYISSYSASASTPQNNNNDETYHHHNTNNNNRLPYSGSDFIDPASIRIDQQKALEDQNRDENSASRPGSFKLITIIICNVIGAGILALPTAATQSSLILGIALLCFNTCVSFTNLYFIVATADYCNELNYRKLIDRGLAPLGIVFPLIAKLSLVVFPFGAIVAYVRVVADAMPPVVVEFCGASPDSFVASELFWVLISGAAFFILSCRRALSELFIVAIFGLLTIYFAVVVVIIRFFDGSYSETKTPASIPKDFEPFYLSIDIFQFIPVVSFALSVHNNAPAYYSELRRRSPAKMMKVFGIAHVIIVLSYLAMMIFGLITFGNEGLKHGHGDILDSYRHDDTLVNVARFLMFVHFIGVFPILEVAVRRGLNNLILGGEENLSFALLVVETFIIVLVASVIGAVAKNIDDVFSITGALFGSIVVMILPAVLFLRLVPKDHNGVRNTHVTTYQLITEMESNENSCCGCCSSGPSDDPDSCCWGLFNLGMPMRRGIAYFSVFWGTLSCALGLYTSIKSIVDDEVVGGDSSSTVNATAAMMMLN